MNRSITFTLISIISNINASESTLSSSNDDIEQNNNIQFLKYDMKQVKKISCNIFELNREIQDFVTKYSNSNNIISNTLRNLSINSIVFSVSIYKKDLYNISSSINTIKFILSNLLNESNLDKIKLKQIQDKFSNICNILHNM